MTLEFRVDNVTVRFGSTVALDNLTLASDGGRITGLIGRNGAGKTTLLTLLAAFRKANEGDVLVAGQPVFENANMVRQICLIRDKLDIDTDEKLPNIFDFVASLRPH